MTRIIHIETSTKVCSVAISENGLLIDEITEKSESFAHSERLNFLLEDLIYRNNLNFNDLNAVSVSSGPGSYTGLRIGVSTAKGLCFALNIPLIAVDSLFALANHAKSKEIVKESNALTVCMIDARRMEAFTAVYDSNLYAIKPIAADIFDENYLMGINPSTPIYLVGDSQQKCKDIWCDRKNIIFTELEANAIGQVKPAFEKFQNSNFVDLAYFEPFYLKDFQSGKKTIKSHQ